MTQDILSQIVERKKEEVRAAEARCPAGEIRARALEAAPGRSFLRAMTTGEAPRIIAEIKRASPSRGVIRPGLKAADQAGAYEKGGAAAVSVLTDAPFFHGSLEDLARARQAASLPVLRKEFIISAYQIYESRAWQADAILLIVRVLAPSQLKDYLVLCEELGLDALVEVHTQKDLAMATDAGAALVGINNRNLVSFDTDIGRAVNMVSRLAPGQVPVAASGISKRDDIETNLSAGIENFLVGESLVRADDPVRFLRHLRTGKSDLA